MRRSFIRTLAPLAAIALIAGGCSDSDDDDSGSAEPTLADDGAVSGDTTSDSVSTGDGGVDTTTGGSAGSTPDSAEEVQTGESLLDTVIANDSVRCGVRTDLPGFSTLDPAGDHVGFDADFCRVIAAAVLGDATKVEFVDVETENRFTALQSGEIDVLVRNTTWTASRDGIEGATFLHPTFYDGQGMMVKADSGYASLEDMDGAAICVAAGTTTEGNVATEFARRGFTVEVLSFPEVETLQTAFQQDRCDGWSSDTSQLTGLRSSYPDGPDSLVIFDEVFSKEPLAPVVADGDSEWAQAVNWAILSTIQAEEFELTSANVDEGLTSENVNVTVFLGGENADGAVLDTGLGLPADFAYQVITQVGNYGEIYEEHLAPLGLERGVNALWIDGGLQYAPPYR